MIVAADLGQLADLAFAEAERHPPRTPQRRAASHLAIAASIPPARSLAAVKRAVESFGTPATQQAALALLDTITRRAAARPEEQTA